MPINKSPSSRTLCVMRGSKLYSHNRDDPVSSCCVAAHRNTETKEKQNTATENKTKRKQEKKRNKKNSLLIFGY